MPAAFEHLKSIKWGLGFGLSAVVWAVFVVTTIQAYLGGTQYESPLLLTLLAVTASTMAVGVITAGVSASTTTAMDEHIGETATAAYVFANAAGTLATLIGHLAETWETGRLTNDVGSHDALTIILDLLSLKPETYFASYLIVTGMFAVLALPLVLWGAHLIVGKHVAGPSELACVGVLSLCLLVMGLLVGTPWAPVGEDTRAAMKAYGAGLRLATLVLIVLSFAIYALLVALSLGRFAAVFSFSAIRVGAKVGGENVLALVWQLIRQLFYGVLIGVVAVCIIGLMWFFGVPLVAAIPTVSGEAGTRFVEAATKGLVDAAAWLLWASAAAVAVLLLRLFGKATIKGVVQLIVWVVVGLYNLIKLLIATVLFIIGVLIEAIMVTVRFVVWLFRPRAKLTAAVSAAKLPKPAKGGWFSDAWSRVAPRLSWPTIDWGGIGKLVAAVILCGVLIGGSVWAYNTVRAWFPPTPDEPPTPTAFATPEGPPPPPGFEFSTPQAISLCEASPGGFDWALAREDRLEVALDDCVLPARIQDAKNGVLVVVSVSSFSSNEAEEKDRALRRARALAGWASSRTPAGMPVYVLNLGMARSERAFGIGWRLFGQVRGVRPALCLMLTPYPEGSTVPTSSVLEELASGLRFARVSNSFTDCQLFKFNPTPAAATDFEPVAGFNCAAL